MICEERLSIVKHFHIIGDFCCGADSPLDIFLINDADKAVGFYKSLGFVKATEEVQKEIEDSFNENCDLYIVSLDDLCM